MALVAFIALYGSMVYFVASSRRELAIRMSCGATGREIFRLVVGKAARGGIAACALSAGGWLVLVRVSAGGWLGAAAGSAGAAIGTGAVCFGLVVAISVFPALQASRTAPAAWLRE